MVVASVQQAQVTLDRIGDRVQEPGPHALLLLSALPDEYGGPMQVHCSSRLFLLGEADHLPTMLSDMAAIVRDGANAARSNNKLWGWLNEPQRHQVEDETAIRTGRLRSAPFSYDDALQAGLLWDPRGVGDGIGVATGSEPLSPAAAYVGVGVATLDTDATHWTALKSHLRINRLTGLPRTSADVQGTVWAYFAGDIGLKVHRWDPEERWPRRHEVLCSTAIASSNDTQRVSTQQAPDMVIGARPAAVEGPTGAVSTRELWDGLRRLHLELEQACGPADEQVRR